MENESNVSVPLVRADYMRDTLGYSGSGIKIGMIEGGLPDRNQSYFTTANIIYDPTAVAERSYGENEETHANQVAAIMVAKSTTVNGVTYCGIVPDATLYATCYSNYYGYEWRQGIEWLLSQGVQVINMSAKLNSPDNPPTGEYDSNCRWIDHVAINHSVHFVKAAGNEGGYVSSPGLSYNAIVVGNLNDNNTLSYEDDNIWDSSNYLERAANGITPTNKPDLVAPGTNINTAVNIQLDDQKTGTSYSAPHVTAIIAQLCQRHPTLKTKQDAMKAILTASINHKKHAYTRSDTNYDKYGAGMIDARSAAYTANAGRFISSSFAANTAESTSKTYTFTVTSSDEKIRISLAWLKYATISGTHANTTNPTNVALADLDLYVYDPNGSLVGSSVSLYNNVEIIQINNPVAGTYTIEVDHHAGSPNTVYFGLAWW